jgi:hypothetical protein
MAEAKVESRVTLVLSAEEASAVQAVLGRGVVGPDGSRRKLCGHVYRALEKAGVTPGPEDCTGTVRFL